MLSIVFLCDICHSITYSISARFLPVSVGRASERASVAGTTVKGALCTFACGVEKQGSIHGVCIKVLGFFGFGDKKRLLWGSFGGVLVVFGGLWVV